MAVLGGGGVEVVAPAGNAHVRQARLRAVADRVQPGLPATDEPFGFVDTERGPKVAQRCLVRYERSSSALASPTQSRVVTA